MAAHRYWRAVALEAYGAGDLELSCFHLLDVSGARVDAPATLTASIAPATGAVANLQDDDLTTAARWSVQSVATLTLNWDFVASPSDVRGIRLSGASEVRFPLIAKLQWSDDGSVWTDYWTEKGIAYPGAGAVTTSVTLTATWSPSDRSDTAYMGNYEDTLSVYGQKLGRGPVGVSSGIVQFEVTLLRSSIANVAAIGVATAATPLTGWLRAGYCYTAGGTRYVSDVLTTAAATYVVGDVIGVVINFAANTLTFYKNGASQGALTVAGLSALTLYPAFSCFSTTELVLGRISGDNFAYPVAGATAAWSDVRKVLTKNAVAGRLVASDPITVGTGPAIIYGIPALVEPANLTVPSGAVKDFSSGVLGTGRGRVAGTVKEKGTPDAPVYRKVRLIREIDGLQMRELWSDPVTGAYSFDYVDELQKFTVLSYDHTGDFRAVVADGQIPELIA